MRKEAWHTQRQDQASGVPLEILEHLPPKPESAYFLLGWLDGTNSADMSLSELQELHREDWCAAVHRVTKSQTRLSD